MDFIIPRLGALTLGLRLIAPCAIAMVKPAFNTMLTLVNIAGFVRGCEDDVHRRGIPPFADELGPRCAPHKHGLRKASSSDQVRCNVSGLWRSAGCGADLCSGDTHAMAGRTPCGARHRPTLQDQKAIARFGCALAMPCQAA